MPGGQSVHCSPKDASRLRELSPLPVRAPRRRSSEPCGSVWRPPRPPRTLARPCRTASRRRDGPEARWRNELRRAVTARAVTWSSGWASFASSARARTHGDVVEPKARRLGDQPVDPALHGLDQDELDVRAGDREDQTGKARAAADVADEPGAKQGSDQHAVQDVPASTAGGVRAGPMRPSSSPRRARSRGVLTGQVDARAEHTLQRHPARASTRVARSMFHVKHDEWRAPRAHRARVITV